MSWKMSAEVVKTYKRAEINVMDDWAGGTNNTHIDEPKINQEIELYNWSYGGNLSMLNWYNVTSSWFITNAPSSYSPRYEFILPNVGVMPTISNKDIVMGLRCGSETFKYNNMTPLEGRQKQSTNTTATSLSFTTEQLQRIKEMADDTENYILVFSCDPYERNVGSTSARVFNHNIRPLIKGMYTHIYSYGSSQNYAGIVMTDPYGFLKNEYWTGNGYDRSFDWLNMRYWLFTFLGGNLSIPHLAQSYIDNETIPLNLSDHSVSWNYNRSALLISKKKLTKIMNAIGIPWVILRGNVDLSLDISELNPDYEPPVGQKENEKNVGGGGGEDNLSDVIELSKPSFQPFSMFNTMYTVNGLTMDSLRSFLWDSDFLTNLRKLTSSPIENIVSCRYFPFNISQHSPVTAGEIYIGNIDTNLSGGKISSGYDCMLDMGYLDIRPYWNDFADYQHTHIDLYLPYYGFIGLNTDEVMDKRVELKYIIDISTGDCTAVIMCGGRMIDCKSFTIGFTVPLTGSDSATLYRNLAGVGVGAVSSIATGNVAGTLLGTTTAVARTMLDKRHIEKSGNASALNGLYMPQYPFITIHRPYKITSSDYQNSHGYPIDWYGALSDCTGYCRLADVQIDLNITTEERNELKSILERGFYV